MKKAILLSALAICLSGNAVADVTASDTRVRAVPPGQPNSAAFMTLTNGGNEPVALTAATSPVAKVVELHTHTNVEGVMQMRQVPKIEVPAHGTQELRPGGYHVMLIGLKQDLTVDSQVPMTLTFSDGNSLSLEVPVQQIMPMHKSGMMHQGQPHHAN